MVGKRRAQSQDEQAAGDPEQDQSTSSPEAQPPPAEAGAPAPSAGLSEDAMTKLKQLSDLRADGVLTDEEFAEQKERLLA
jgi:hypothetical protein